MNNPYHSIRSSRDRPGFYAETQIIFGTVQNFKLLLLKQQGEVKLLQYDGLVVTVFDLPAKTEVPGSNLTAFNMTTRPRKEQNKKIQKNTNCQRIENCLGSNGENVICLL